MSDTQQPGFDFTASDLVEEAPLVVDLDGYEGPLHVLLALARSQKVDMLQISVTQLADQYLAFIAAAQRMNVILAADYLVMASWLAYLKSRLLLPAFRTLDTDEPGPEELAQDLARRLARLDALRKAAEGLQARAILGRDVFPRGDPEQVRVTASTRIDGDLYALIQAYVIQRAKTAVRRYRPPQTHAFPLEDARNRLRDKLPELRAWTPLAAVAPFATRSDPEGPTRASYLASTLAAGLELVREGELEARQLEQFADVFLRTRMQEAAE